jgi:c-di-GMP-binding flagellar brake protein YcgR
VNGNKKADMPVIALWERLTLALHKDGELTEFLTRVEDIKKNSLTLEMPVRHSGRGSISKGDEVEVSYNRKDACYTFKANITDLFEGESGSIEISRNDDIRRVQRRKFVRLDISGEMKFRILDISDSSGRDIGPQNPGSLLNISAGGVLFETESEIREGVLLILNFTLRGNESLENILASVKRVETADDDYHLVGAEFITDENMAEFGLDALKDYLPPGTGTFDKNLQKLVVQYIHRQQVRMRREGRPS